MNGQYAIKGYLLQSLVALLDSFESNWKTVCVEPNDESEKVDIKWTDSHDRKKVVQVKSSKNPITLSSARHWADDLKSKSPDADEFELVLVGYVEDKIHSLKDNKYNDILIVNKNFSIEDFETLVISKINVFFEKKGKSNISSKLGKLFARALNQQVLQGSVFGETVSRDEFESNLLESLQIIERYLEKTSYSLLLPDSPIEKEDIKSTIIEHVLNLIGWTSLSKDATVQIYNEKLGREENFSIDYWADYESPLKGDKKDTIYINADLDAEYPTDYLNILKHRMFCVETIRKSLISEEKIDIEKTTEHCVQFILSLNEAEQGKEMPYMNDLFKSKLLDKEIVYYAIDNKKADFLISSIITARKFREELIPKFLYPITEDNSQIDKIGKRGTYLPPQYLNSSILPIIKEDSSKISVLLFCSDPYSKDRLRKVLWLLIRLTSGMANEYKIYFTDFDKQYSNEINEVMRSYNNKELTSRVCVEKLPLCNSSDLQIVPLNANTELRDEDFDETTCKKKRLKVEPHLIEYLPYGDSLKPFLASDAVKSDDLKLFLRNKGVFFKTADKTKIIQLMTSMLFSSLDIESLVDFVNINARPLESSSVQYSLVNANSQMNQLFARNAVNQNKLQDGLKADIVSIEQVKPNNSDGVYVIKVHLEQKNPNKQALVSIARSTAQVTVKKDSDLNKLEFTKEYNSKLARTAAERIVKQLSEELIRNNEVEEKCIEICFSEFTNKERINFLLSFTNIESSTVFTNFNAKSLKYMFDELTDLPAEYQDKRGKECVTQLKGRNLDTIKELQDDLLKEIILSEEMAINYRYKIRGISGNYFVVMNFSNALSNRPLQDGVFNVKSTMYIDSKDKEKVPNIQNIDAELKKAFNQLKKEKLQLFNKI